MKKIILPLITAVVILTLGMTSIGCGAGGSVVYAGEVKNVLNISEIKQISGDSSSSATPILTFTIKNISDGTVSITKGDLFKTFSITIFSVSKKDGKFLGQPPGQPTQLSLTLQPRETRSIQIPLFPSDETTFKIVVEYIKLPAANIQGKYIKAKSEIVQQIEDKLDISYEVTTKTGDTNHAWFVGKVKNISGTTLSLPKKGEKNDVLTLKIGVFDKNGKTLGDAWPQINLRSTGSGLVMAPGESINYEWPILSADAAKIARYEIQLYYWTPGLKDGQIN